MFKKLFIGVFLLALMLSACATADSEVETAVPSETPTLAATAVSQATLPANQPTETKEPGCTARSRRSVPDPTLEALLPPPGEDDWVVGPDDAYVTLIEYGDYQ
jgi:hypothetical protein